MNKIVRGSVFGVFLMLLQLLFIGLKLTDNINWSWWLVLTPAFVYILFYVFIFTIIGSILVGIVVSMMAQ